MVSADDAVQRAGRLYAERRYEPALELLDQVDASARVGTSYWLARGHVLRGLGQRQQAIRAYELGLQFGPDAHISAALSKLRSSEAAGTVETPSGVSATQPDPRAAPARRPNPPMTDLVLLDELGLQFAPDAHISAALSKLRSSEAAGTVETPSGVSATQPGPHGKIARPNPPMTDLVLPDADADFGDLEHRLYKKVRAQRRAQYRATPLIFRLLVGVIALVAIVWIAFVFWSVWPDIVARIADR